MDLPHFIFYSPVHGYLGCFQMSLLLELCVAMFLKMAEWFSKVLVTFYIPTVSVPIEPHPLQHSVCHMFIILVVVQW